MYIYIYPIGTKKRFTMLQVEQRIPAIARPPGFMFKMHQRKRRNPKLSQMSWAGTGIVFYVPP